MRRADGSARATAQHHGPPEANQSSRIDRQTLGILLFIVSEVMLFGSFFAAYFFLRVVANVDPWPPEGIELPKAVAGTNTAIRHIPPPASPCIGPWSRSAAAIAVD